MKYIQSEKDYDKALARIFDLLDAEIDTPEGKELDRLAKLVELYEKKHFPMEYKERRPKKIITIGVWIMVTIGLIWLLFTLSTVLERLLQGG